MFDPLEKIFHIVRILKTRQNIGDAAALKLTLFHKSEEETPSSETVRALKHETFQKIELDQLSRLPKQTFGFQYYKFLTDHSLAPLNFSSETEPLFEQYPVSVRYIRVHDMFHIILGFEPTISGEVGVYAFIEKQSYNDQLNWAAKTSKRFSSLIFWKSREIAECYQRGARLGAQSQPLIEIAFEQYFAEPLEELRNKWLSKVL